MIDPTHSPYSPTLVRRRTTIGVCGETFGIDCNRYVCWDDMLHLLTYSYRHSCSKYLLIHTPLFKIPLLTPTGIIYPLYVLVGQTELEADTYFRKMKALRVSAGPEGVKKADDWRDIWHMSVDNVGDESITSAVL